LLRIARTSAGNPFYALELARAVGDDNRPPGEEEPLPGHLQRLVAERIAKLSGRTRQALLLASALTRPTLTTIELAGTSPTALAGAEAAGVVQIQEGCVRFTHPLLAAAAYISSTSSQRRRLHRRLADAVSEPEERARHLALAANRPQAKVAAAVERAAARARARGAPDAAAELLDQALRLTPPSHSGARRRRALAAAEDYFYAGDRGRARSLLEELVADVRVDSTRIDALFLLGQLRLYDDSWPAAVPLLEEALALAATDPARRARIALALCYACFNIGDASAADSYVAAMRTDAELAGEDGLLAQALGAQVAMDLVLGRGVDEMKVQQALALEDWDQRTMLPLRPTWLAAQAFLFSGQVGRARTLYVELRQRLIACGLESDLPAASWMTVLVECLCGEFVAARRLADEAVVASLELESLTTRVLALSASSLACAYLGFVDPARKAGEEAQELAQEIGWMFAATITVPTLGFLALSVGDVTEAHRLLGPLAEQVAVMGLGEPMLALYLPDELEALIALGELDQAEQWLLPLEQRGQELGRVWALATSARCRGLLLAARGDLEAAADSLDRALAHHQQLEMPFELGRTLLVKGQIQRRRRQKRNAKESLERAKRLFDQLETPLWSAKAVREMNRLGLRRAASLASGGELSETEARVAALAGSGLTNREIAARLFVSPKTVEVNLSSVYRKLSIHSRAELGARMKEPETLQT
jgi:DNA-binding CsgD family transcriptional regulator